MGLGEGYRCHRWHELPLTERPLRACLAACWSVPTGMVAAGGIALGSASWSVRWLIEPIVVLVLVLLLGASPG